MCNTDNSSSVNQQEQEKRKSIINMELNFTSTV